jgi:hypothetical protein
MVDLQEDPRDEATIVVPGAVGVGLGAVVGLVAFESVAAAAVLALVGATAGHAAGVYHLME